MAEKWTEFFRGPTLSLCPRPPRKPRGKERNRHANLKTGYRTSAFGKWHVGMNWQPVEGGPGDFHYGSQLHGPGATQAIAALSRRVNHRAPIEGGPADVGFDTFFGSPSNCTRIPVFIRDRQVVDSPARDRWRTWETTETRTESSPTSLSD